MKKVVGNVSRMLMKLFLLLLNVTKRPERREKLPVPLVGLGEELGVDVFGLQQQHKRLEVIMKTALGEQHGRGE